MNLLTLHYSIVVGDIMWLLEGVCTLLISNDDPLYVRRSVVGQDVPLVHLLPGNPARSHSFHWMEGICWWRGGCQHGIIPVGGLLWLGWRQ